MIVPYDYQADARCAIFDYFAEKVGNPLVLMPTGTGKSVVIGDFIRECMFAYPYTRAMVVTHVETLIDQNFQRLLELWPTAPAGIYSAGLNRYETMQQIIFAGIQSVYTKASLFVWVDLLIIDEAHLVSPKDETMYQAFINALHIVNPKLKVIGLTATNWRLGSGRLTTGSIFTDVAIDMTTPEAWNWFVDNGYLSPLCSKKTQLRLDDSNIGTAGGEYIMSQQQKELDKYELTRQAVREMYDWGTYENRTCWLAFATGVSHCEHVAEAFEELGISAIAIHSKTKDAGKKLEAYKNGEYQVAVSMNKLTTGVDVAHIDLIGVLRFTKSSSLWVQMLGRGTRPVYGDVLDMEYDRRNRIWRLAAIQAGRKPNGCRVLDFAHNTERLGPINNPVISEPKSGKKKSSQGAPVRVCPSCAEYVHASKPKCPCGYEFGIVVRIEGQASEAEVMTRSVGVEPIVEIVDVERITYTKHQRRNSDKPPSLCVMYYLPGGMRKFSEYICFEHEGSAKTRAHNWWSERLPVEWPRTTPAPKTIDQAKEFCSYLRIPKRLRVWTNAPHPRIMSYEYE
jgi:DNA repair protein RadD